MLEQDKWISTVEELIQTCRDGQEGYRQAAENVKDPEVRAFFNDQYQERGLFATELEDRVAQLGKHGSMPKGSATGALHRAWMGVKNSVGAGDESILSSVEAGEDSARDAYEKALKQSIPEGLEQTIRGQLQAILASHEYVKAMRDRLREQHKAA